MQVKVSVKYKYITFTAQHNIPRQSYADRRPAKCVTGDTHALDRRRISRNGTFAGLTVFTARPTIMQTLPYSAGHSTVTSSMA